MKQDTVCSGRFPDAVLLLNSGVFRGEEGALARLNDFRLASSFHEEVEFVGLYPGEGFGCEGWTGPPDFHGCDHGILSNAEVQALGGLTLKSLPELHRAGDGFLFLAFKQDRDPGPGSIAVGGGALQVQGDEVSCLGAPAVFEDLDGRGRAIADPCIEISIGIPVCEAEAPPVVVLIDSGNERDVGKEPAFLTGIKEERILLPATEGEAFAQVDIELIP